MQIRFWSNHGRECIDCTPAVLVSFQLMDLKNNLKHCDLCNIDIYGDDNLTKHFNENHPQHKIGDNSYPALYWMIVIPGLDHLRLNASKSIIQAYWHMFFRDTLNTWLSNTKCAKCCIQRQ